MVEIYFVPLPCKTREKGGVGEEGRDVREPNSSNIVQFSITFRDTCINRFETSSL